MYGRQSIQIRHRELDAFPFQLLVYVHNSCEVRAASKGISPRLEDKTGPLGSVSHQRLSRCLKTQSSPGSLSEANAFLHANANSAALSSQHGHDAAGTVLVFKGAAEREQNIKLNSACSISLEKRQKNNTQGLWCILQRGHPHFLVMFS